MNFSRPYGKILKQTDANMGIESREQMTTKSFIGITLLALALTAPNLIAADVKAPDLGASPRLLRLTQELQAGNRQALADFWKETQGKAPLEEPIAGDKRHVRVSFLWRGDDKTTRVSVFGGLPSANLAKPLRRLAEADVWYLTEVHPTEARFQYVFQINGPESIPWKYSEMMKEIERTPPQPDPLNSRNYAGWSYVELPDAPPQRWIKKQAVPTGRIAREKLKSKILNAEYSLNIYTPPGYDKDSQRCWLAVAFDGGFLEMETTLDNLLAAGKIPAMVVVGVKNINRDRDLSCSDEFADFLATELVPWARKSYRVYDDASHTLVGGASLAGKMAAWCGLKHSEVFGKVLSQSGSFQTGAREESAIDMWTGEAPRMVVSEFLRSPRLPVDFYIEVGRYETTLPFSPLMEDRRLRDVLIAKGYRVTYSEYVGGHNEVCWRGSLADGLMALTAER
jgi:enterochelin esterase-like enzyme